MIATLAACGAPQHGKFRKVQTGVTVFPSTTAKPEKIQHMVSEKITTAKAEKIAITKCKPITDDVSWENCLTASFKKSTGITLKDTQYTVSSNPDQFIVSL
jgi:hypothetical protein